MLRILDRYIFRELCPPFLIGLLLFTFVLLMNLLLDLARYTIKGDVDLADVLSILVWSVPHILALTIPMSVLLAANLGLGRLSADNEITVLNASGVGLMRIGRPVFLFCSLATLVTAYVFMRLVPEANQKARAQAFEMGKKQLYRGIREKEFFERYSPYVIYPSHIDEDTNVWHEVMVADSSKPEEPRLTLAAQARMHFNESDKYVVLEMQDGETFTTNLRNPEESTLTRFKQETLLFNLEKHIPEAALTKGDREMGPAELSREIGKRMQAGLRWRHYAVELHKKFAVPTACAVFGVIGLAVGARNRSRGRSAGFVVSLGIILVYYIFITSGERLGDQGDVSPWLSMWAANILIGGVGLVMLLFAAREIELGVWDALATAGIRSLTWVSALLGHRRVVVEGAGLPAGTTPPSAFAVRRPRRPTIVIRIPRVNLDFPRILDRYVLRQWIRTFILIVAAISALYIIVDLSRLIDDISENQIPLETVIDYYKYSLPNIVFLVLGPSALVTTLGILGVMNRNNEIIAMKASGLSIYRIVTPVIMLALLGSVASFFLNDRIIPLTNRQALTRREQILKGAQRSHEFIGTRWMWGKQSSTLYNYGGYDPSADSMQGAMVFELDRERFGLRRVVFGHRAEWDEGRGWRFEDGWIRRLDETGFEHVPSTVVPYPEGPDYFVAEKKAADELSYGELVEYIRDLLRRGFPVKSLRVRLFQKSSLAFVPVVMTLIGVPFALRIGKRGNLFGVGISVAVVAAFWAVTAAFAPLGETGILPPILAAWAPNVLFGVAGLYMLLTLDT